MRSATVQPATYTVTAWTMDTFDNSSTYFYNLSLAHSNTTKPVHNWRPFLGTFYSLISIFGVPANGFVLYLAYRILRLPARNANQGHWFIFSMTAWDFLYCSFCVPLLAASYITRTNYPVAICILEIILVYVSFSCSNLTLLLLNIDKFLRIYKPLHYPNLMTRRRAICLMAFTNMISMFWSTVTVLSPHIRHYVSNGYCKFEVLHMKSFMIWRIIFACTFYAGPVLVSLCTSIYIACIVKKQQEKFSVATYRRPTDSTSEVQLQTVTCTESEPNCVRPNTGASGRRKAKPVGFVFTTTIWSAVTTLPCRLFFLFTFHLGPMSPWNYTIFRFLNLLMVLNPVGNPFITVATQRLYTNGAKKLLAQCFTKADGTKWYWSESSNLI